MNTRPVRHKNTKGVPNHPKKTHAIKTKHVGWRSNTIVINNHEEAFPLFCGQELAENGRRIIITRGLCGEYFCSKMGGSIKKGTPCVSCPLQ